MKKFYLSIWGLIIFSYGSGQIAVGTETPDPSALIDLNVMSLPSNGKKGFLPPRMTDAERMNIPSPAEGLVVYNTDEKCLNFYNGSGWVNPCNGTTSYPPPSPLLFRLGGIGDDHAYYSSIEQTSDGGFIIAGTSASSNSGDVSGLNNGGTDYWIIKLDSSGNKSWDKMLGGSGNEVVYAIQQTTDGGYIVAGHSNSSASGDVSETINGSDDYWIVKLDASGNIIWDRLIGGSGSDLTYSIQQTSDGGYITVGRSASSATGDVSGVSHGGRDFWVVKLDASGNIVWDKLLGGTGHDDGFFIGQSQDGSFIVTGSSSSSNTGDVSGTSHGSFDYWVVKLDATGNKIWDKLLGGSGNDRSFSVQQTLDHGFIVAGHSTSSASGDVSGTTHGLEESWVVKLDAAGNKIWDRLMGGTGSDFGANVLETSDGGFIIAGTSASSNSGDVSGVSKGSEDYWIVKLDSSGNIIWDKLFGGSGIDRSYCTQQTLDGSYVIIGGSAAESAGNGDQAGLTGRGGTDIWIVRLDEIGNIIQ